MNCTNCKLCQNRTKIVEGEGPWERGLLAVGEGPGKEEDRDGRPFVGKAGKELDNYLYRFAKFPRHLWRVDNLVRCRPPKNRDPSQEEIGACSKYLLRDLETHRPRIIATLGRIATRWFLGEDVDMEVVHGIPQESKWGIIVPCYHPASGLHDTKMMTYIQNDFTMLGKVVRGEVGVDGWKDEYSNPTYLEVTNEINQS